MIRTDNIIDFDWGQNSPDQKLNADGFSVRWKGFLVPLYRERYTFCMAGSGGMRLVVDGDEVIDEWDTENQREECDDISLRSGGNFDIQVEFVDRDGLASVKLYWESSSQSKQIIPASALVQ